MSRSANMTPRMPAGQIKKKGRTRTKHLVTQVKDQMEFYFSDANLGKDRFMKEQITKSTDGYMELSLFLKFNKIRQLTNDVSVLRKAMSRSTLLKLSEDGMKVRRDTPLAVATDVDDRTVYVECLPTIVDHQWVRDLFSDCGKVVYVSLPRFKSSGDPKGFAFVEFDTVEAAKNACQLLNDPPEAAPEKPGKFPVYHKELVRLEKQAQRLGRKRRASESHTDGRSAGTKRKRTLSEGGDNEFRTVKRSKMVTSNAAAILESGQKETNGSESTDVKICEGKSVNTVGDGEAGVSEDDKRRRSGSDGKVKKKRKVGLDAESETAETPDKGKDELSEKSGKKRKIDSLKVSTLEKTKVPTGAEVSRTPAEVVATETEGKIGNEEMPNKSEEENDEEEEEEAPKLRVISKHEWLELKKEYLALQKANMAQLKNSLKVATEMAIANRSKTTRVSNQATGNHAIDACAPKKSATDSKAASDDSKAAGVKNQLEFTADVIVSVEMQQPVTRKEIKERLSASGAVAYVDVKDGEMEGYVRCPTSAAAAAVASAIIPGFTLRLLAGAEEEEYWIKANADRDHKLGNKSHTKRRGRDKVLKRAEKIRNAAIKKKHIVFND